MVFTTTSEEGAFHAERFDAVALTASRTNTRRSTSPASSASSAVRRRGAMSHKFDVSLQKGDAGIGLDIVASKDKQSILVGKVKGGAVQVWNAAVEAAGERMNSIQRGDRIVEVDGVGRGDSGLILKAIKSSSQTVEFKLERLLEFKVQNLANVPRDLLGFELRQDDSGDAVLTGVSPAANKTLQQDMEFRVGDLVLEVNGVVGTLAELEAEIAASDSLSVRVRRPA